MQQDVFALIMRKGKMSGWPYSAYLKPGLPSCCRLPLLEEWRGVRDEALSELSGIQGCIFVHAGGFIGGNKSMEGALEMARQTLQAAAKAPANGSSSWRIGADSQQQVVTRCRPVRDQSRHTLFCFTTVRVAWNSSQLWLSTIMSWWSVVFLPIIPEIKFLKYVTLLSVLKQFIWN